MRLYFYTRLADVHLQTQADADAYNVIAAARAAAQATQIQAEAQAAATRIAAEAEAEAIRMRARADTEVLDGFAREMQMRRIDVKKVAAYGNKTVFVPTETFGANTAAAMAGTMTAGMGANMLSS